MNPADTTRSGSYFATASVKAASHSPRSAKSATRSTNVGMLDRSARMSASMPSRSAPTATTSAPYDGSAQASSNACRLVPVPDTRTTSLAGRTSSSDQSSGLGEDAHDTAAGFERGVKRQGFGQKPRDRGPAAAWRFRVTDQPNPYASPTDAGPDPAPPTTPAAPRAGGEPMYAQPGYPQTPSGYAGYAPARNGFGTAALVLGIVGLILFWTIILGVILGVLAIVFGVLGRKRASRREATNGGVALAGAILGGVALAGSIALIAAG